MTDVIPGGKADNTPASAFSRSALRAGTKVEREHTSSPAIAKEIAKDHLKESPGYYRALKKMEQRLEKKAARARTPDTGIQDSDMLKAALQKIRKLTAELEQRRPHDDILHSAYKAQSFLKDSLSSGMLAKVASAALLSRAHDALIWMTGSSDFGPGGKARIGFNRIVRPVLTELSKEAYCAESAAAEAVHEVNRILTKAKGEAPQPHWDQAPKHMREESLEGVKSVVNGGGSSHAAWVARKKRDGWKYGKTKDARKKTHPDLVPVGQLDAKERAKDTAFSAVAKATYEAVKTAKYDGSKGPRLDVLKKNNVPLTAEERQKALMADAFWDMNQLNGTKRRQPAVSKAKVDGKTWYYTYTHRAYNVCPTLQGAIGRFHRFIKGTA